MRYGLAILLIVIVIVIVIVCALVFWLQVYKGKKRQVRKARLQYYRVGDDMNFSRQYSYPLLPVMLDISNDNDNFLIESDANNADLLLFETLNDIDNNMKKIPREYSKKDFVYGVCGSDLMSSKNMLATILKCEGYADILPTTYLPYEKEDMILFQKEYDSDSAYILKKNIQRQEGVKIFSDYNAIIDVCNEYVVIQKLLQDPYTVGGRKINMRVYMLVHVCAAKQQCNMYIYNDGFMYYTPGMWKVGSNSPDENITTGYIDRQVYVDNPLTIQDFGRHVGQRAFNTFWSNLIDTMTKVRKAYSQRIAQLHKDTSSNCFLVYGIDIAPNKDLKCQIMEINKGPDLTYKDKRDKEVKYNMMKCALSIVGVLPYKDDGESAFIKI